MTTTTTTPTPIAPRPSVTGPVRPRRGRNAAIVTGVASVIAVGGYGAVTILGSDAQPPQSVPAQRSTPPTVPRDQALGEARDSLAKVYGPQPSTGVGAVTVPTARDRAIEQNRDSVAKLYGPQSSTGVGVTPAPTARDRAIEQNRHSVAKLYGNGR